MFKYRKLSPYKIKKILYCFSQDLTAMQTANLLGINRNTINRYYKIFREKILIASEKENGFEGELELDESYFGGKHHKDKRGRSSENKISVFGILKRNGKVYAPIIPNSSSETLLEIVHNKIKPDSVVYTDIAYNKLHYRINHSGKFAKGKNHINGIESF